jgi:hypothetical protein
MELYTAKTGDLSKVNLDFPENRGNAGGFVHCREEIRSRNRGRGNAFRLRETIRLPVRFRSRLDKRFGMWKNRKEFREIAVGVVSGRDRAEEMDVSADCADSRG